MMPTTVREKGDAFRVVYMSEQPPVSNADFLAEYGATLSVKDIAEITGVSAQTLRVELADGKLPGVRIGRQWIVPKPALINYLFGGTS